MAENKKKTSGQKSKSKTASKNKKSNVKRVGKDKRLNLSFYEQHTNAIMLGYIIASVLLACIAFIPGYNLWQKLRACFFATTGLGFYLVVAVLIVISVRMCLKNLRRSLLITNISAFSLVANFCGILHLFNFKVTDGGFEEWRLQFLEATKSGWEIGMGTFSANGGTLGAIFGGVPLHLFGKAGAFIVIILVFLVSLFLYLNTDINLLGEKLSEFAVNGRDRLEESNEQRKVRAEEKKRIKQEEKLLKMQQQAEQAEAEEDADGEEGEDAETEAGLSLPFISYGGSSVMFLLIEIGLVLSVARGIRLKDL